MVQTILEKLDVVNKRIKNIGVNHMEVNWTQCSQSASFSPHRSLFPLQLYQLSFARASLKRRHLRHSIEYARNTKLPPLLHYLRLYLCHHLMHRAALLPMWQRKFPSRSLISLRARRRRLTTSLLCVIQRLTVRVGRHAIPLIHYRPIRNL